MGRMDEWAEGLRIEALKQAADTFFGARRAVDQDRDVLLTWANELRRISQKATTWTAALNCVLGGEDNSRMLFRALGIPLPDDGMYRLQACMVQFSRPRSFTRQGLYCKIVWSVYEHLADLLYEYHHGRPVHDPKFPGQVLHTPSYGQVMDFCTQLNQRIHDTNVCHIPSETLGFVRRLDPIAQDQASLLGGEADLCSLDKALALSPVDPKSLGLLPWPEPPAMEEARKKVREVCSHIFQHQRQVAEEVLRSTLHAHDKQLCIVEGSDPDQTPTA